MNVVNVVPKHIADAAAEADKLILSQQSEGEVTLETIPEVIEPSIAPDAIIEDSIAAKPIDSKQPDWEQKYRVLQGKYDSEVPRLNAQIGELRELVSLVAQKNKEPEPDISSTQRDEFQVDPEELDEYEPKFIALVEKLAARKAKEMVKQLEPKIQHLEQSSQYAGQTAFESVLSSLAPNWRELNTDNRFLVWLDEVDELSGVSRRQAFNHWVQQGDAGRVAKYFNAFSPTRSSTPSVADPELEKMVTPRTQSSSITSKDVGGRKTYTRSEITKLYEKRTRGGFSSSEFAKIEADIFAAQREGRIVG